MYRPMRPMKAPELMKVIIELLRVVLGLQNTAANPPLKKIAGVVILPITYRMRLKESLTSSRGSSIREI